MVPYVCKSLCIIFGFIMTILGLLLGFYVFPLLIDQNIDESVMLINGSDAYKRWETLPIPLQFKVYFFNVTNSDKVQLGDKPKVNEVGPYVYDQLRHKYDIIEDNDTLSYYQNQIFKFNKQASKPNKEDDIVTVVHLPLMVVSTIAESRIPSLVNKMIPTLFHEPKNVFITTTPKNFLFDGIYIACDKKNKPGQGILKLVCKEIKRRAPVQLEELNDGRFKFSLLSYKNNTHDGHYKTNNGVKNINLLGEILSWKDSSNLNIWKQNSTCNNIYGTDTTIFPPHQTPKSKIKVFQSDVCRSINLHYNREITYQGIAGLRYTVESDMLASSTNLSSNECFCLNKTKGITGEDGCLLDGAMELWNCQNVPAILTFPHFYLANEVYKNTVDGLSPNRSLHQTFVDLEPESGIVLRGSKRVQFNIFYRKIDDIDITQNLSNSLMPIVWIDEDAVHVKRQPVFENTINKYMTKDNSNSFHVVELEEKKKIAKELEGEYDPYNHREVQHPTTFLETLFHLMKGSLGTGILAMPKAFENAGYVIGVIGTITIGLLSTYCIRVLIKSEYELCKRRKIPSMTYPGTMEASLEEGPQCLRRFAKYCPHITNTFLMVYQLGTCCVYTVFIAENLKKALDNFVTPVDVRIYMAALLLPLILINWVRNLKLLAPLSTIANGITFISFSIILYYLFRDPISFEGKDKVGEMSNFPLFLGTVLFALEAIGVIMPLENEMKKPKSFISDFGILNIGMTLNIVLYVSIGLFGYIWHGKGVDGTITKNLPKDEILSTVVQILLAISIFITHSLQCYVAIDISWNEYIQPKIKHTSVSTQWFAEYIVRTLIVIMTFILSISIPELELFISLFGALCLSALGISFPALIQTCTFWKVKTRRERIFLATKNCAVILFGLLGLIIGTYTSLDKIIHKFTID